MKKLLLLAAAATLVLTGCKKDNNDPEPNTVVNNDQNKNKDNPNNNNGNQDPNNDNPSSLPNFLKACINRDAHPIFKFSGALDVGEFNRNQNGIRDTVSAHFDEIVAGNAMKYGSVVNGSGKMDFSRVKQFCADAKSAGLSIFGHTLAWHSQQQPGYLLGLMKDKEKEVPEEQMIDVEDYSIEYSSMSKYDFWHGDFKNDETNSDYSIDLSNKMLHIKNNKVPNPTYSVQYVIASNLGINEGVNYNMTIKIKASAATTIGLQIGSFYPNCYNGSLNITDEMKEYTVPFEAVVGDGHIMLQSGEFVGDIWIESVNITHKGSGETIPLTEQEKRDALATAMDNWIKGMMDATDGYVKAWDVVNEALSGADGDGDDIYDLQNYKNNNIADPTNVSSGTFYWQVYMGDLEYVRTAVASARKHFKGNAADLKLFINDYNLESTWDDNGKLKSLIKWIEKWEADGVTKIDGIGTQMHITCYENTTLQKDCEEHIVKMLQLMANTGKLVRISELDMGYKRGNDRWNGQNLATAQLTAAEHQKMADYYKFIVTKYFEIVPPAQQYGICQWCLTDAAGNVGDQDGWRNGEPVGIWTQGFKQRKAAFKGFAEGLAEKK
ncbi:MAG: endo-1,4-beta-xylanase [Bacteroidales bacterium]|nr:endo-1,4-beta-xylanase [Bacteroidales bacterium]